MHCCASGTYIPVTLAQPTATAATTQVEHPPSASMKIRALGNYKEDGMAQLAVDVFPLN